MKQTLNILIFITSLSICIAANPDRSYAQNNTRKTLSDLQQDFVDLRFGMFIHYNIPTYQNEDWADPEASPAIFDPKKLDCNQWATAAKSANMTYGCLTTKHHSGFAIWNTRTTDYSVMNSPLKRDVVKEFADAFRANDLKVMLYYSILDTHHKLRPNSITPEHIKMVKAQLTELLTNYGEISAIIIDGWDAPWSRISYDEIPFEEVYTLIKSIQPNCLVMDLNAAKYPAEALFYTDIKSYEQNAGQHISKESNRLPAMSCLPLNNLWFWKTSFPNEPVRKPSSMVNDNIIPLNDALCNFMLNVAPNRDGLLDDNALAALKEIGDTWSNKGPLPKLQLYDAPIISTNLVKKRPSNSSWGYDSNIMDFANDDNFGSSWVSNPVVEQPWLEVSLDKEKPFNMVVVTESRSNIKKYHLEYYQKGVWKPIISGENSSRVKVHRFPPVQGSKVRITIDQADKTVSIAELGVYNEKR